MRLLDVETAEGREALKERLIATALLADAQGRTEIGDHLLSVAEMLAEPCVDVASALQSKLLAAEAMLHDAVRN